MSKQQAANHFINALARQVRVKSLYADGIEHSKSSSLELIASVAEELGEAATDYVRGRYHGTVAECVDIAHSALLLASSIDKDGEMLKRLHFREEE